MTDADTIAAYRTKAATYDRIEMTALQAQSLERFLSHLPKGAHILDLGCGPGRDAARMQEAGFHVSALDATPEFVAAAQDRGVAARLGQFDDLTEVAAYDAVWASFSLLHAPRADFDTHLAAIARALRPGGFVFLGMKLGSGETRDRLGRFYTYYSEAELLTHLARHQLTPIHCQTDEGIGLAGDVEPFILITAHA